MFIGEKNTPNILTYMRNVNLSSVFFLKAWNMPIYKITFNQKYFQQ